MDEMEALALAAAAKKRRAKNDGEPQKKNLLTKVKENVLGDNDPTTQNFGEKVGSLINKAGESMTFGLIGDEASAAVESAIPGVDYDKRRDHYRQQEELVEQSNPGLSLAADIGGALALPIGAVGAGLKGATMAGKVGRVGGSAATTGALSGAYGFAEGEGGAGQRVENAKGTATTGAAIGAAIPVVGGAVQRVANAMRGNRAIAQAAKGAPTSEQLAAQGRQLYDDVDAAGVQIKADTIDNTRQQIVDALTSNTAYSTRPGGRTITPNTSAVMDDFADMSREMAEGTNSALPFREVDHLRRQAGAAASNVANKSDQRAGMTIIEGLDDMVKGLGPDDVVAGDVKALQSALPKAREVYARMSKSQLIDDAIDSQGNYLSGDASAIRNQFARILRSPKLSRGFTDAEREAMRRVVSGNMAQQFINYLGGGLGVTGQIGLGVATGPLGAGIGLAGAAASRQASNMITRRNAEIARALVANGGLQSIPQANPAIGRVTEQLLRQGSAAAVSR